MKATFAKVLALVLVLVFALSGCNLIEIDAKMQADEDIAKIDEAYSQVIATYNGGDVTVSEVIGDFNNAYNEMAYMYYYYMGTEISDEEVRGIMQESMDSRVRAEITAAKFDAAYTLTEEEIAATEEEIQAQYESNVETAMETAEGKDENAKRENVRVMLREYGVDYDSLYDTMMISAKQTRMEEILREEITEVTDEELQEAFDSKASDQQVNYADGRSFENDMSGSEGIVCWYPEGYRTVKHILVMPEDDIKSTYANTASVLKSNQQQMENLQVELILAMDSELEENERTPDEIQVEIDALEETIAGLTDSVNDAAAACLNNVKEKTDEIYSRLEAGEDFEALIAEYGEDPGMMNEPTMSRGYCVSAASQNWEINFRNASMALENVGDYTIEPVVSGSGVHIIKYMSDLKPGAVDLESVRADLTIETLLNKQESHCLDTVNAWVDEAAPSYDLAAFEAAIMAE